MVLMYCIYGVLLAACKVALLDLGSVVTLFLTTVTLNHLPQTIEILH